MCCESNRLYFLVLLAQRYGEEGGGLNLCGFMGCPVWGPFRAEEGKCADRLEDCRVPGLGRTRGCGAPGSGGRPRPSRACSFPSTDFQQGLGIS